MEVDFPKTGFSHSEKGEIVDILRRIVEVGQTGSWSSKFDEIRIRSRLQGGRSGSDVLDVVVKEGKSFKAKVIKIGPRYKIEKELKAFSKFLRKANAYFIPIEAATPSLFKKDSINNDTHEAIVYDAAERFLGNSTTTMQDFEEKARRAVLDGGEALHEAINNLEKLFRGLHSDLYDHLDEKGSERLSQQRWDRRLGVHAVVAIDHVEAENHYLRTSTPVPHEEKQRDLWSYNIADISLDATSQVTRGDRVRCTDARMYWRGEHLIAEISTDFRLEIVCDQGTISLDNLKAMVTNESVWSIFGRLESLRMPIHQKRLLDHLGGDFSLSEEMLTGPEAVVPNPFALLPAILRKPQQPYHITSPVHGDLNPRNILLINDFPCVIDYAQMDDKEPLFMDFCRLEGCLFRDVVSNELSWAQQVHLQRLLAVSCRLGDDIAQCFLKALTGESVILANAFLLLWTIRQAARDAYPEKYRNQWEHDYIEQLFLFAHLTLKWDQEEELVSPKLRATAAMMGVAAEVLSEEMMLYNYWREATLQNDAYLILQFLVDQPQQPLRDLSQLAKALTRLNRTESLHETFEQARAVFVRHHFRSNAQSMINRLEKDHKIYINLKAYIDLKGVLQEGSPKRSRMVENTYTSNDDALRGQQSAFPGDDWLLKSSWLQHSSYLQQGEEVMKLIAIRPEVVLCGDAGAGKSTVACELEYLLAQSLSRRNASNDHAIENAPEQDKLFVPRLPLHRRASHLSTHIQDAEKDDLFAIARVLHLSEGELSDEKFSDKLSDKDFVDLLTLGAFYIIVDALNELAEPSKSHVIKWICMLRANFPQTPVLVCHRVYNYNPELLPFPIIILQKVGVEQARQYIRGYFREKQTQDYERLAERLSAHLLDGPDELKVHDLAQTPLFLWMLVEYYQRNEQVPESRGKLFETFSRWYLEQRYQEKRGESASIQYSFEDKALLLGALGFEMVQRGSADFPEEKLASLDFPKEKLPLVFLQIQGRWRDILREIIDAEFLIEETGGIDTTKTVRFLHQSFQDYFTASHILPQCTEREFVRKKLRTFEWREIVVMLLGFAGEARDVVSLVLEEALKVNPRMTADLLRVAERPDNEVIQQFIASQEDLLWDSEAGEYLHNQAAEVLTRCGRLEARKVLWQIVRSPHAPVIARTKAIKELSTLMREEYTQSIKADVRQQFIYDLPQIFDETSSITAQLSAIEVIDTYDLKELVSRLGDLIEDGEWSVQHRAWQACNSLRIPLSPGKPKAFRSACRQRLPILEKDLYSTGIRERIEELQKERLDLLGYLATSEDFLLLLDRRFKFGIGNNVGELIDEIIERNEPPPEKHESWDILTEPVEEGKLAGAIDRWLTLVLHHPDNSIANAAGHRLLQTSMEFLSNKLSACLHPNLSSERLSVIAYLVAASSDEELIDPLEALLHKLMITIPPYQDLEGFSNLLQALDVLAPFGEHVKERMTAIADWIFYKRDNLKTPASQIMSFPWIVKTQLDDEDYSILINAGNEDAEAAIFVLSSWTGNLMRGQRLSSISLNTETMRQFLDMANKQDAFLQRFYIKAAAMVEALDLLPFLLHIPIVPEMRQEEESFQTIYGVYKNCLLANLFKVIGYLARLSLEEDRKEQARSAVKWFRHHYSNLEPQEERSVIVGLTTGLGYLGDWKPILTHLGPGEPWMHDAAYNVFDLWFPSPLSNRSKEDQYLEAAIWISKRMRDHAALSGPVRSTLSRIKELLEKRLGRYIGGVSEHEFS